MREHEPPRARLAPVLAGLGGVRCPRRPVRSGRGSVASISSRSVSARERAQLLGGRRESAPNVSRAAVAADVISTALARDEVRHGLEAERSAAPACSVSAGSYSRSVERVLDQVLVAPRADHAAEALARPAARTARGTRRVPGQRRPARLLARRVA